MGKAKQTTLFGLPAPPPPEKKPPGRPKGKGKDKKEALNEDARENTPGIDGQGESQDEMVQVASTATDLFEDTQMEGDVAEDSQNEIGASAYAETQLDSQQEDSQEVSCVATLRAINSTDIP